IEVVGPVLTPRAARRENPDFFHRAVTGSPFVALKLATSMDGRIAAKEGVRTRLTGPETRRAVHALRAACDGVVVGSTTALVDDPRLTVREDVPFRKHPARVVLDGDARLEPDAALFQDVERSPVIVFTRQDAPEHAMEALEAAGATVHPVPAGPGALGVDLEAVLGVCEDTGLRSLLVEGGGRLARSFLAADRVERLHLFVAPMLCGERGVPAFPGDVPPRPERWDPAEEPRLHGDDVELVWDRPRPWSHGSPRELLWTVSEGAVDGGPG
ncbi:MAG: RibD family protein, partial [Gemmatimonadota bacterium]